MNEPSTKTPKPGISTPDEWFDPVSITRPVPQLLQYYVLISALTLVAFPFVFVPLYFRYRTLRYRFDEEGISIARGLLFRKEVNLTYARIQDIHVTRNVFQRWMGLATIEIQTASGSATAEATIEGVLQPDALRDFLYARMRGSREDVALPQADDVALGLLAEIRDLLRTLARKEFEQPDEPTDVRREERR